MLIAPLIAQAGARAIQGPGNRAAGGKAFAALKGAITSGSPSGAQSALKDIHKLLVSAGSIAAASSVENKLNRAGSAIKSGGASTITGS
jgi:hypothetical protein